MLYMILFSSKLLNVIHLLSMLKLRLIVLGLLFWISLYNPILSSSQSISTTTQQITKDSLILITPSQLKITNLIFNEHSELKEVNKILQDQIVSYKRMYQEELMIDSIYESSINDLIDSIYTYDMQLEEAKTQVKKTRTKVKWLTGYGVSVSLLLLVCLL